MHSTAADRPIAYWLLTVAAAIFAMVVLGGVTRLTHSGLSIVEWKPLVGAIPPLSEADWLDLFQKYQRTPEYQKVNLGMDLEGFKGIFWLEYLHRLLGRSIGVIFLAPFVVFLVRREIERPLAMKLVLIFVLGGLQGLMGWLMVASGLVDAPRVSAYRLTAHLGLAILIYGYVLWVAFGLLWPVRSAEVSHTLRRVGIGITSLVVLTVLAGGFVAGTRAGLAYNDWPLMHGRFFPEGLYAMVPIWVDVFENIATVQFHHRMLAYALTSTILLWWSIARRVELDPTTRTFSRLLLLALAAQLLLGIATLWYRVPTALAATHQAGALLVFSASLALNHRLRSQR